MYRYGCLLWICLDEVEAVQIITLHSEGYTQKDIARRLRSQSTVSNILRRYQETGNFAQEKLMTVF